MQPTALPPAPRTLDEVEQITDPVARAGAAVAYLTRLDERQAAALLVRNNAIRAARGVDAPSLAAKIGVSTATVKAARRTHR